MNTRHVSMAMIVVSALLLSACGVFDTVTPTATPKAEVYEKLDPSEVNVSGEASFQSITQDAFGNVTEIDGVVTRLNINGKPIELASGKFVLEGGDVFIETRDYGKIKVTFGSYGRTMTLWLKPSQREQILGVQK